MRSWSKRLAIRVYLRKGLAARFYVYAVVIILVVIVLNRRNTTTTKSTKLELTDVRPVDVNIKTILLWNDFFSTKHFGLPLGSRHFAGCKVKNCQIWDRLDSEPDLPHDKYDALVFHGIDTGISSIIDLPLVRRPEQRYIFLISETPVMRPDFYNLKDFFNWTVTYRKDSDLYAPYMKVTTTYIPKDTVGRRTEVWREPTNLNASMHIPELFAKKTKMVAWFVTSSGAQSKRDLYVNNLARYISVDIYGPGRNLSCSRDDEENCDVMLDTTYKFYLAFENSLCKDYVTEKFTRALTHFVVPVVYGGADYKTYAPPLSYIDVKDFASPKELARYLHYLAEHPKEYQKYFWWKQFYKVEPIHIWCNLCEKLHDPVQPNKVYSDFNQWWNYTGVCWTPREHFSRKDGA